MLLKIEPKFIKFCIWWLFKKLNNERIICLLILTKANIKYSIGWALTRVAYLLECQEVIFDPKEMKISHIQLIQSVNLLMEVSTKLFFLIEYFALATFWKVASTILIILIIDKYYLMLVHCKIALMIFISFAQFDLNFMNEYIGLIAY